MIIGQHYEDEALIALLERGGRQLAGADEHISSCAECSEAVAAYSSMIASMHEPEVWQRPLADSGPSTETIAALRAFAAQARLEDEPADALVAELTAGEPQEWLPRLEAEPKYVTAGVVRRLGVLGEEASGKRPAEELAFTELATTIAERLDPASLPVRTVERLRGDAWRARAYALDYTGDFNGALAAVKRAKQQYDLLPVADYDLSRLELTRALILRHLDRLDEGLAAVHAAMGPLELAEESRRLRIAQTIEAAMRWSAGDARSALQLWLDLVRDLPSGDDTRHGILNNIAACYRQLGEYDSAIGYYRLAAEAAKECGATAELERFRWIIGTILLHQQRFIDAETVLTSVIKRFNELAMHDEAILARLDVAELLIVEERYDEAIRTCEEVVRELTASGLEHTKRALTAVTYLREATQAKRATPALARKVRDFVHDARTQPALLFAPPPR